MDNIVCKIKEFDVVLTDFKSKSGLVFKKISIVYDGEELFMFFVDGKLKTILKLLGYNINDNELMENA